MIDDEETTRALLNVAGARRAPSEARTARVRAAVLTEFRAAQRRRRMQRIALVTGLCAAAAVVALVVWVRMPAGSSAVERLAVLQRIQGPAAVQARRAAASLALTTMAPLFADDVITTAKGQRAAIQTRDGSSVRLDERSRVRLLNAMVIEVEAGAVYIATAPGSHGFEVRTTMGTLRDIGTQFEVRLDASALRVRVRSGMVEVDRRSGSKTIGADMEAEIRGGAMTVRPITGSSADWAWTADLAPPFDIEGQPLQRFLEHLSREQGWRVTYADRQSRDAAAASVLHGSVAGLSADDALRVVLGATGLVYELRGDELVISRATTQP